MKAFIGQKQSMTQRFRDDGTVVPVTIIAGGPSVVTQVKTAEKDGYAAIQLGWGAAKRMTKPLLGHVKELGPLRHLKEFRVDNAAGFQRGQKLGVEQFSVGDVVQVSGWSKGRGFQGVVKRHHFKGGPASHGHKDNLRMPGSIGATFPQHVTKGTRMAGRMAVHQVSLKGLRVIEVDATKNRLVVSGALPGARNGLIIVTAL